MIRRCAALVLALAVVTSGCRPRKQNNATPERPAVAPSVTTSGNMTARGGGSDAASLFLAPDDRAFIDARGGAGWGDRCWTNIKAGRWDYAKAECDKGMAMNPASPQPRASLLYNEGLIAEAAGQTSEARRYFQESLGLREHPDVRAGLERVSP